MKQVAYEETLIEKDRMQEDSMLLRGSAQDRADVQYENFCANGN